MHKFLYLILCCLFQLAEGQDSREILNDGPYIFKSGTKYRAIWVSNGEHRQSKITRRNFAEFSRQFNLGFDYHDLVAVNFIKPDYEQAFTNVDSIVAISDIHGAYDEYTALLKSQGIIDNNLAWNFGRGHLVVLGDIFDRGEQVTKLLWHLFALEKQAEMAGGKVHVMLGNHEIMTFSGDQRYISPKYPEVARALGIKYQDLYSDRSVLGKWLRHKPVIATIDSFLFVHAGISGKLLKRDLSIAEINRLFVQMLVEKAVESKKDITNLILLTEQNGPVWYRGFFEENSFTENTLDSLMKYYRVKSIVAGHTTSESIRPVFRNKIIGIDAGLGEGRPGALLIIKGNALYSGTSDGKRQKL